MYSTSCLMIHDNSPTLSTFIPHISTRQTWHGMDPTCFDSMESSCACLMSAKHLATRSSACQVVKTCLVWIVLVSDFVTSGKVQGVYRKGPANSLNVSKTLQVTDRIFSEPFQSTEKTEHWNASCNELNSQFLQSHCEEFIPNRTQHWKGTTWYSVDQHQMKWPLPTSFSCCRISSQCIWSWRSFLSRTCPARQLQAATGSCLASSYNLQPLRLSSLLSLFVRLHAWNKRNKCVVNTALGGKHSSAKLGQIFTEMKWCLQAFYFTLILLLEEFPNGFRDACDILWYQCCILLGAFFCCSLSQSSRSFFSWSIRFLFSCCQRQVIQVIQVVKLWEAELIHFKPDRGERAESSCFFFPFSNSSLLSSSWEQLRVCSPLLAALPSETNPNSPWSRSSECLSAHREEKENGSAWTECHSIWILLIFLPDHQGHNRLWYYDRCTMSMWLCLCLLQKLLHLDMAH